jgi:hypothetical protein
VDDADRQVFRFETTAKASADAHALANDGLRRFDRVVDAVALVVAAGLIVGGYALPGGLVALIAVLSLIGSRVHPVHRLLTTVRFRSLLGQTTEVTVDDEGVRFENPLGSSFIPWTTVTSVKSNQETVALFRHRLLVGYIPANAFGSAAAQASVVAFANERIPSRSRG